MANIIIPEHLQKAVTNFTSEIDSIVDSQLKALNLESTEEIIYHYTNSDGLRGILENKNLRLSDISHMNDPSEINHGVSLAAKILSETSIQLSDNHKVFSNAFNDVFCTGFAQETAHYFTCSFSEDGNDLGQWRAYADDARGYVLGFDRKKLEATLNAANNQHFRIKYDDGKLEAIHRKLIGKALQLIPKKDDNVEQALIHIEFQKQLSTPLASAVVHASIYFKHAAYAHEKEYRFLQMHKRNEALPDGVKKRYRPYELIKFTELNWEGTLKSIMVGPAANQPKAKRFAEDCLAEIGLRETVPVTCSDIPYRSFRG